MSKNKNVDLRVSTILNKQILFPLTEDQETKKQDSEKLTKAFWEKLRRKPQYIRLCDGIDFNKLGLVKTSWYQYGHTENKKLREKEKQARQLFGIPQLLDPSKSYEELHLIIHVMDVVPVPIEAIASKDSEYSTKMIPREFNNPRRFIEDGKYLTLKIDVTQKDKHINESFKLYLEFYRQFTGKEQGRNHSEKEAELYYTVWDERLKLTPFPEIARNLGIEEEAAKKQFGRAFELIIEKKYNKDTWYELIKEKLIKDKNYNALLKIEEIKQQHKLLKKDEDEGDKIEKIFPDISSSLYNDPEAIQLLQDVKKKFCQKCSDLECRVSVYAGDLEVMQACPRVLFFIQPFFKKP